jgi:hypothetical protein
MSCPDGANATEYTGPRCPTKRKARVCASEIQQTESVVGLEMMREHLSAAERADRRCVGRDFMFVAQPQKDSRWL